MPHGLYVMHIAIAGNIGSGKTTLTTMLAKRYGWKPRFESVDYNPYLEDYYKDIKRWSFPMEVFFLKERFKMPLDYLENLNKRYEEFIKEKYKGRVLTIDVDHLDYQHRPKDFGFITDKIDRELFGLF